MNSNSKHESAAYKNMPKNYSKAIINYLISNPNLVSKVLPTEDIKPFLTHLKEKRIQITKLSHLHEIITDQVPDPHLKKFNKAFRILG